MVKTFNTCADLNIKYQKTLLQCTNKFRASITVGQGQVLMRVSIARVPSNAPASVPIEGNEWAIVLRRENMVNPIETVKLKDLEPHKTVGVENMLAIDDVQYTAYLTMIKTSDSSEQPTTEEHLSHWNNHRSMAIIFEVC